MLEVKDVTVTYASKQPVIDHMTFNLPTGRIVGILGPNGAGKSTLMKAMLHLVPYRGEITFNGQSFSTMKKRLAYVEQRSHIDMDFPITVLETVLLGTYRQLKWYALPGNKEKEQALDALETVGLLEFQDRQISELSGGQFQRVLIARTLVQHAEVIFLDEPFVGVDTQSEAIIIDTLKQLKEEGKTIFIVHHDLTTVIDYFDDLILLDKQLVAAGPVEEVFTDENIVKLYGPYHIAQLSGKEEL